MTSKRQQVDSKCLTERDSFIVHNGFRQWRQQSYILFVYLSWWSTSATEEAKLLDCLIGNIFVGALACADYLTLIVLSAYTMRRMFCACSKCATEYSVTFNARKRCVVEPWKTAQNSFYVVTKLISCISFHILIRLSRFSTRYWLHFAAAQSIDRWK